MKLSFSAEKANLLVEEIESHGVGVFLLPSRLAKRAIGNNQGLYFADYLHIYGLTGDEFGASSYKHNIVVKNTSNYSTVSILLHEFGHWLCNQNNCECMKSHDRPMQEFCAIYYELCESLRRGWRSPLMFTMRYTSCLLVPEAQPPDRDASFRLLKTSKWKEAESLLGKELRDWLSHKPDIARYAIPELEKAELV